MSLTCGSRLAVLCFLSVSLATAQQASPNSSLTSVSLPDGPHIFYLDNSGHVNEIWNASSTTGQWQHADITADSGAYNIQTMTARSGSPLAVSVIPSTGIVDVAYIDTSNNVDILYYSNNSWGFLNVTASAHAPLVGTGSGLTSFVGPVTGSDEIAYIDATNTVQLLYYLPSQNAWEPGTITSYSSAPAALTGSALTSAVMPNGTVDIGYINGSRDVELIYFANNAWGLHWAAGGCTYLDNFV